MSQKAITVLVFLITGLLVIVVIAGLIQGLLEITAGASMLCAVLTGIVAGSVYDRNRSNKGGGD